LKTPSNLRGSGLVGEISNRITEAFTQAKAKLGKESTGVLVIDEADDIATSRAQNQAHHEDRAGLNVLIKQIDSIRKEKINLAVILITNRIAVLDPAVRRRTTLHLQFERPDQSKLKLVFEHLFKDIETESEKEIKSLISFASKQAIPYSFSDLTQRVAKQALFKAIHEDKPFSISLYKSVLEKTEPSPLIEVAKLN
jgi:AAA+ superfamily predicted ATPase